MRPAPLFVTFSVVLVVLVSGSAILDSLRNADADADVGSPGAYASRGGARNIVARNVILGESIKIYGCVRVELPSR